MPGEPRTTAEQRQHLVGWLQRPVQEHLPRAFHCTVGKKVGDPDHPSLLWAIPCKHVLKAKLKLEFWKELLPEALNKTIGAGTYNKLSQIIKEMKKEKGTNG